MLFSQSFGFGPGFKKLEFVVLRKIHAEFPGHGFGRAKVRMHHHTFHPTNRRRQTPWRIAEVAPGPDTARPELTHHTCQPFRPIAGPEGLAVPGTALDENFFGGAGNHRVQVLGLTPAGTTDPDVLRRSKYCILYKTQAAPVCASQ